MHKNFTNCGWFLLGILLANRQKEVKSMDVTKKLCTSVLKKAVVGNHWWDCHSGNMLKVVNTVLFKWSCRPRCWPNHARKSQWFPNTCVYRSWPSPSWRNGAWLLRPMISHRWLGIDTNANRLGLNMRRWSIVWTPVCYYQGWACNLDKSGEEGTY